MRTHGKTQQNPNKKTPQTCGVIPKHHNKNKKTCDKQQPTQHRNRKVTAPSPPLPKGRGTMRSVVEGFPRTTICISSDQISAA